MPVVSTITKSMLKLAMKMSRVIAVKSAVTTIIAAGTQRNAISGKIPRAKARGMLTIIRTLLSSSIFHKPAYMVAVRKSRTHLVGVGFVNLVFKGARSAKFADDRT